MYTQIRFFSYLSLIALIVPVLTGCTDEDDNGVIVLVSQRYDKYSHKAGHDCSECHRTNGAGIGWFTVSGTVYDSTLSNPYPNLWVYLRSGPDEMGELYKIIEVDGFGNFYTTQGPGFEYPLYPSVMDSLNRTVFMNQAITHGNCNSCHGETTDRIWKN
ncbi:MAG: hypothetical protein FJY10_03965 [Bacteroidetes bacterium]|nr:hypothetical protein [Bacteroidota bacterium]